MIFGIDVSNHQGQIDWGLASFVAQFAFVKATEGTVYTDPFFLANWEGAKKNGLVRGAYHFARPSSNTGREEALYFIHATSAVFGPGDIAILDSEDPLVSPTADLLAHHIDFENTLREYGYPLPVLYSSRAYIDAHNLSGLAARNWGLWIADWQTGAEPRLPAGWAFYAAWQYGFGQVPGVQGSVDLDIFNGSREQLLKYGKVA